MEATFLIIGGGIAGVSCAESLALLLPNEIIYLISESALIKTVTNVFALTKCLQSFDVTESSFDSLKNYPNIKVIHDFLNHIDDLEHTVKTSSGKIIKYKYLCLCTGASPKLIPQAENFFQIIGIRDTDSVENLLKLLSKSKNVMIVGNGGIATELIYQMKNIECHWVIKDKHISSTFVDPGAAEFFQSSISDQVKETVVSKRMKYTEETGKSGGAALGPDWYKNLSIAGANDCLKSIKIHYESKIETIKQNDKVLEVKLSNGMTIFCDFIISATGVRPNLNFTTRNAFSLSNDQFINVDEFMRTSLTDIYAAGDICNTTWTPAKQWFQMKLWTQARQMGSYAAKCMSGHYQNEEILQDFCFEIFTHSTKLFGYKVILLGLFNGQNLGTDYEIMLRMTKGHEYVKLVLQNNRLQGALLIGDTDLEEM